MNRPRSYLFYGSITVAFIIGYIYGPVLEKGFREALGILLGGMSAWYFIGILFVLGLLSFIEEPSYLSISWLRASRRNSVRTAGGGGRFRKHPLLAPEKVKKSVALHPQVPREALPLLPLLFWENLLRAEMDNRILQALALAAILHATRMGQSEHRQEAKKMMRMGLGAVLWGCFFPHRKKIHSFLRYEGTPRSCHAAENTGFSKHAFPHAPLREGLEYRGNIFRRLSSFREGFFVQRLSPAPRYLIPIKKETSRWFHGLRDELRTFLQIKRRPSITVEKKAMASSDARVFCTLRLMKGRWHKLAMPPTPHPNQNRVMRPTRLSTAPPVLRKLEANRSDNSHSYGSYQPTGVEQKAKIQIKVVFNEGV